MLMLTMVSMGAWADVKVVFGEKGTEKFEGKGGTIEMTGQTKPDADDFVTVTFTVSPDEGYIISMPDIEVYETIAPNGTRADLPQVSTQRELDGEEPYNLSAKRDYYITVKSNLGLWIKTVNFRTKYRNTKRGTNSVYFIANNGGYTSPTGNNYYMVPAADPQQTDCHDAYYSSNYILSKGDPEKPFIATFKTNRDNNSIWEKIPSSDNDGYFYIRHWLTGKYLIYEPPYSDLTNRKSVHLQTTDSPGENAKFDIASNGSIRPISLNSGNRFLNPANNNSDRYYGSGGDRNSAGLVGVWKESTGNSIWHLEETVEPPSFTINADGTVEMSSASGTTIRFTTDSSTPTASNGTVYSSAITITNEMTTINAVAINSESKVSNVVTLPLQIYTYYIVNRAGDVAIQHTSLKQAVGKVLNSYLDIPSAIRSPYLDGETIAFYTFSGDYLAANLTDENKITETPDADANIYVTYTTDHLLDKFLKLRGARAFNIKVGDNYIYNDGSTLASESTDANKASKNHLWYFTGNDPYAVQVKNADTGKYLVFSTAPTFSLSDTPANFILMSGSTSGDGTTYDVVRLREATGNTTDNSAEVSIHTVNFSSSYYLIDKAGKLIAGPVASTSSELSLPDEWKSPLVSAYHYYTTSGYDSNTETYAPTNEITNLLDGENVYVTYDVSDAVDLAGFKTYMLKFSDGVSFNQEDGSDGIISDPYKAVYPYNNGEFHLYVYGKEQWESQLASGASTRTRWLWHIISSNNDPYHVIFKSEQNQTVKDKKTVEGEEKDYNFAGNTYLRTYKPDGYGSVVTDVAYESEEYNSAYSAKMPTRWVNGEATEYMILGSSMLNMTLKTFDEIDGARQTVTSFEQYWKNNPTANNLLAAGGIAKVTGNEEDVDLTTDQRTFLESANASLHKDAWHSYNVWAYTKPWEKFENGSTDKALKNGEHWLQTISMGTGNFTLEEVSLVPQVILLDQHGWEIMRVPMYSDNACTVVNTDALNKYNSPMVETYHWYPKASKRTGYHKYEVKDSEKEIIIYAINDKNKWVATDDRYTHTSSSLSDIPYDHITSVQDKSVKTDFYVTYDVNPLYASSYTGAATADATTATPFLLKQDGSYATTADGSSITTDARPENLEDVTDNMQWYLKPNFDIDREMGYKYLGEVGAQDGAKSKAATEEDNFNEGRNGFDPYNVQIQNKKYPLRYVTTNTTDSKLDGGVWSATTSNSVSLQNMTTTNRQTATGYDQTTLNITNATFMVVDDGAGNMRLMPRFDHSKAFTSLTNDEGAGTQSLYTEMMVKPTLIHSSAEILQMNGYYVLASDFTCTASVGTSEAPFTGIIDGQLNTITGTISQPLVAYADGAIIRNVILEEVGIEASGSVGALCCTANGATRIYNCGILSGSVKSTGTASSADGTDCCGGLVGLLDGTSRVINCYSYATIKGGNRVGGIVGYNNGTTKAGSINTMVMNCMFYGDIEDGSKVSPIYGGNEITNLKADGNDRTQDGLNTFNYFSYENLTSKSIDFYNCALAVEEKYLNRFEYYRLLLNSNKKLAAWYATGSVENGDQMAKWVLETADRTINNPKPYPVLKAQRYYPSIINIDADNAPSLTLKDGKPKEQDRKKGGKLGTLSVTILKKSEKTDGGQSWPSTADVQTTSLPLVVRTDMDEDRFNFNYDKIQLPYYNDVGTGNYTENRVVTGWKITDITTLADDPYTEDNYDYSKTYAANQAYFDYPNYNFADRKSSNKDKYSISGRVFSQGAYFDVPYGVTSITIEPYWAKAAYIADPNYDVVFNTSYGKQDVSQTGIQAKNNSNETLFNGQKIYTSINNALGGLGGYGPTVYDNAVVLVGNFHQVGIPSQGTNPFTLMSVDIDNDHEPDYSMIYHHSGKKRVCPIRFDFLNIPGTSQAQKPNGADKICNMAIIHPSAWFEITNTSSIYFSQLEYEDQVDNENKTEGPLILQGGIIDQIVSANKNLHNGKTIYVHVGGNVWFKEFNIGIHGDGSNATAHVPVSVTGGDYESFYLTGIYNQDASVKTDNAECYISGGHFKEVAGAGQEAINGSVRWQIYDADIDNFFGGGSNGATGKNIKGDVTVDIFNSHVTTFCGGPKFGNMESGKKVTTTADGCVFGKYFGAGYGGTAYSRKKYYDLTSTDWSGWAGKYVNDRGKYFDGSTTQSSQQGGGTNYGKKGIGVATDFDYEFFVWSGGDTGGRFFVKFASFSLAQCNEVESNLTNCTINENFYGGGKLGKVAGTVTSVLDGCTVKGNVFGAGFSASMDPVPVRDAGFGEKKPTYNKKSGMFEPADWSGTTPFTWKHVDSYPSNGGVGFDGNQVITTVNLEKSNLGSVAGNVTLTLKGNTTVGTMVTTVDEETEESVTTLTSGTGNVYGGGESSYVTGAANKVTVNIEGTTHVYGNVFGGGDEGVVEGSTEVNIMYTKPTPTPEP